MIVGFRASFTKDLAAIQDARLLRRIETVIRVIESADSLRDVPQVKRLSGYSNLYRIRLGDFRLGLSLAGDRVECVRILHRRDIYRHFP
jgi:mRNA interferase RelE/StbE